MRRQARMSNAPAQSVLEAMRRVPRHEFVPPALHAVAYDDRPLPIGHGQTISQPTVVAHMTELARPEPSSRVLEAGTGSGFQTAVLAEMCQHVYSVEIVPSLARTAAATLHRLGYTNVETRIGNAFDGWPGQAPFDAIVVTAAPPEVPQALVRQLRMGGTMVVPVGIRDQVLCVVRRTEQGAEVTPDWPVQFVPLIEPSEAERSMN